MLPDFAQKRKAILSWADAALAAVEPAVRTAAVLARHAPGPCALLALGKAASGMAAGARRSLGENIATALLIGPDPPPHDPPDDWRYRQGEHPLPGQGSLAAGRIVAEWLAGLEPDLPLLVLLSGGGSVLAELPVAGLDAADLQRLNRWLLASGLDIHAMNAIRARFSRLKRGGLLRLAGERPVTGLAISDVPGDVFADIASGPLSPQTSDWPAATLPDWLQFLHRELPLPDDAPPRVEPALRIVARNADALDAAERAAAAAGHAIVTREGLSGDAARAGLAIAHRIIDGPPGVYFFGGETTVVLPDSPGPGGRNQQLALAAAMELADRKNLFLLALATDGIDGNTADAGALIDGGSVTRMRDAGFDPHDSLTRAGSNAALEAAGDIVHTGPTGTNVMDIVIGLKADQTV